MDSEIENITKLLNTGTRQNLEKSKKLIHSKSKFLKLCLPNTKNKINLHKHVISQMAILETLKIEYKKNIRQLEKRAGLRVAPPPPPPSQNFEVPHKEKHVIWKDVSKKIMIVINIFLRIFSVESCVQFKNKNRINYKSKS